MQQNAVPIVRQIVLNNPSEDDLNNLTVIALDIWRIRSAGDTVPSYVETRSLNLLLFGFGTCEDYLAALIMMLADMGVETRYMTGLTYSVDGLLIYHSWIQAKVDNIWYHLDCELEDGISRSGTVRYRYFMKSDATMSASHYWGQSLVRFGGERLQSGQIDEIMSTYAGEDCPKDYPTPAQRQITVNPEPDVKALRAELLEELNEYDSTYGKLKYIEQNIFPPVFVRYWHSNDQEPADQYDNFVSGADFIRDYPSVRLMVPPEDK